MKYEVHLDPVPGECGVTFENHDLICLEIETEPHLFEWFMSLPNIKDRLVVVFERPEGEPEWKG